MGQRRGRLLGRFFLLLLAAGFGGFGTACDRSDARDARAPATNPSATQPDDRVTVASLVPAATDLLIGMGVGDNVVAVSNYDVDRPATRGKPRVGDYLTIDWEKLAELRPDVLITFARPDRLPEGVRARAAELNVTLTNVKTDTLDETFAELQRLGQIVREPAKASAAERELRGQLDAVRARVAGRPRVRTLVIRDVRAQESIGQGNFIDELLTIAGGDNALKSSQPWPSIARETLVTSRPDVIVQLLPDATPQQRAEAERFWATVPQIPAVQKGRVYILTDWYLQQPGYHVGRIAEQFARALHPDAFDAAATRPSDHGRDAHAVGAGAP